MSLKCRELLDRLAEADRATTLADYRRLISPILKTLITNAMLGEAEANNHLEQWHDTYTEAIKKESDSANGQNFKHRAKSDLPASLQVLFAQSQKDARKKNKKTDSDDDD